MYYNGTSYVRQKLKEHEITCHCLHYALMRRQRIGRRVETSETASIVCGFKMVREDLQ